MSRCIPALLLACMAPLFAQDSKPPQKPEELKKQRPKAAAEQEATPPEEDSSVTVENFGFNPLQAQREIRAGDFYAKGRKNYRAAAGRYRRATKYDETNTEAWLKLGEAAEKLKDPEMEKEAYSKYLEIASDAKNAAEIRKKLSRLK